MEIELAIHENADIRSTHDFREGFRRFLRSASRSGRDTRLSR